MMQKQGCYGHCVVDFRQEIHGKAVTAVSVKVRRPASDAIAKHDYGL